MTTTTPQMPQDAIAVKINWIPVVYSRVLNGSVRCYAYVEGKKGRVQVINDGSVNITGRFTNDEMAAMFQAIFTNEASISEENR